MGSKVAADVLVIIGLVLATWGSVLLGLDALGARELIHDDADEEQLTWGAQLLLTATVNTTSRFIVLTILGFLVTLLLTRNFVTAAVPALITYFFWRFVSWFAERLTWFLAKHPPWMNPRGQDGASCVLGCIALLLFGFPWILLSLAAFALWTLIEFGVTLPSYWIGERTVRPAVLNIYRSLANIRSSEDSFGFRATSFRGMIYLFAGFLYQLIGSTYLLLSDLHEPH